MIRTSLRAAVLAGVASLVLGVAPAHAATYNHDDAVGDARGFDEDGLSARAQERAADITQLRVRHGEHRLIMRLETVNLTRRGSLVIGPYFVVDTPTDRYRAQVGAISFRRQHDREVQLTKRRGRSVRCQGLFADFDFAGDVSMLSIPRRCIGDPRRVTVKAAMLKIADGFDDVVVDSAMDDGRVLPLRSTPAIRTPRRAI